MRTGSKKNLVLIALVSALLSSTAAYMSLTIAQLTTEDDGSDGGDGGSWDDTGSTGDGGDVDGSFDDTGSAETGDIDSGGDDTGSVGDGGDMDGGTNDAVSKIMSITNANPDVNGTNVPTGIFPIGQFAFETAANGNAGNELHDWILTDIIFNVRAENVDLDPNGFRFYNKAGASTKAPCAVVNATAGSSTLFVACRNIRSTAVRTNIVAGASATFVLEGNIRNAQVSSTRAPSIQVSLDRFTDASVSGIAFNLNHIRWVDQGAGGEKEFWSIDYPETVVQSTLYGSTGDGGGVGPASSAASSSRAASASSAGASAGGTTGGATQSAACLSAWNGALPANQAICKACLARACTATDTLAIGLAKCVICSPASPAMNVGMPTITTPTGVPPGSPLKIGTPLPPAPGQDAAYWEKLRQRADDALRHEQLKALEKKAALENSKGFSAPVQDLEQHPSSGPGMDRLSAPPSGPRDAEEVIAPWESGPTDDAPGSSPQTFDRQIMQTYFQQKSGDAGSGIERTIIVPTPDALMNIIGQGLEQLGRLGVLLQDISGGERARDIVAAAMERLSRGNLDPLDVENILRDAASAVSDAFMRPAAPRPPTERAKNVLESIANLLQITIPAIQRVYEEHGIPATEESQRAFDSARARFMEALTSCQSEAPDCGSAVQKVLETMGVLRDVMESQLKNSTDAEAIEREIEALMP